MNRVIAIGDIHGCLAALETLLNEINPVATDTIVFLGDYIDRGLDSKGVIEAVISLRDKCNVVTLMGNHEEMLLAARCGRNDLAFWLKFGGEETLLSYGEKATIADIPRKHIDFFENCLKYYEIDSHIFIHAAYEPHLLMEKQTSSNLMWNNPNFARLLPHCSGKTVIAGHTAQHDGMVLDLGFFKIIDTFCKRDGGWLTGLDVKSGQCWQTNEKRESRPGIMKNV